MSLVLQRFYETLTTVSCSAVTGEGIDALVEALRGLNLVKFYDFFFGSLRSSFCHSATRKEYENDFYAALMERKQKKDSEAKSDLERLKNDAEEENEPWSDDED